MPRPSTSTLHVFSHLVPLITPRGGNGVGGRLLNSRTNNWKVAEPRSDQAVCAPDPRATPSPPTAPPLALRAHRERRRSKEGRGKRKGKEKGQEQGEHSRLKEEKQHITRCCKGTWRSDSEKSPGVCEGAGAPMSVTPTGLPAQGR